MAFDFLAFVKNSIDEKDLFKEIIERRSSLY